MIFIDTHTHIFLSDFDGDRQRAINRAKEIGVEYMIMPNIDSSSVGSMLDVANEYNGYCIPLIGLHPTSVKENYLQELEVVSTLVNKHKFFGIGEIGIDLYWDKTFIGQQKEAFSYQLKLAKSKKLPVVIHSRNSFDEILEIIDQEIDDNLKGVFHSYSGTLDNYHHIKQYKNFKIGIGGVVTYKHGGVDKVLENMDLNDIILETDSPYLSPVPLRGKRNESANLIYIAKRVAEIFSCTVEEVAEVTTTNAKLLFSLK